MTHIHATQAPSAAHVAAVSAILENLRWYSDEAGIEYHHLGDLATTIGLEGRERQLQQVLIQKGYECPVLARNVSPEWTRYLYESGPDAPLADEVILFEQSAIPDALKTADDPVTAWDAWCQEIATLVGWRVTGSQI